MLDCTLMGKQLPNGVHCMLLVNESNDLGWDQDVTLRCFRQVLCLLNEREIVFQIIQLVTIDNFFLL